MKKRICFIFATALLLSVLFCIGIFTASGTDTACSESGCTGSYQNGICSADATHYQPAVENGVGANGQPLYEISNAGQLFWFAAQCENSIDRDTPDRESESAGVFYYEYYFSHNAVLTADITLNENVIVNGQLTANAASLAEWSPIGFWESEDIDGPYIAAYRVAVYKGIFDGNGHTISGLYFNDANAIHVGLFTVIGTGGVVQDLSVTDAYLHAQGNVAIITPHNYGTVSGCTTDGILSVVQCQAASITIRNDGLIEDCVNRATVRGDDNAYFLSGIVSDNYGIVKNSANFGTIGTSKTAQADGLVLSNYAMLENCYSSAMILGRNVGAIAVYNQSGATVVNCYYNSELFSGHAVAENLGGSEERVASKTAAEFADGTVCALVGFHVGGTATCQGAECEVCGKKYDKIDPENHTSEEYSNGFRACCGAYQPATQKGVGENGMPLYEITNVGELYWFAELVNKNEAVGDHILTTRYLNARLTRDITVNAGRFDANGSYAPANGEEAMPWVAIMRFGGDFDGNGKTISGLYLVDRQGIRSPGIGLFASLGEFIYQGGAQQPAMGRVRNLGITNSYFEGIFNVGSIAGAQYLGTSIEGCWADAFVKGGRDGNTNGAKTVGGLVGEGRGGRMENCAFFGVITHEVTPTYANIIGAADVAYRVINSYSPYGEADWHDTTDQPSYRDWYKSREAFASGEVTVLLNSALGYHYFGQLLGTDAGPVIGGPAVYASIQLNCTEYGYANTPVGNSAHIPASEWSSDGEWHWHSCTVAGCDERLDAVAHAHDHACDTDCNVCGATRTTAHVYDNACDAACNICGVTRTTAHVYDNACDIACNVCNEARTVPAHADTNEDYACDACNAQLPKKGISGGAGIGIGAAATATVLLGGFSLLWFVIKKRGWSDLIGFFKK